MRINSWLIHAIGLMQSEFRHSSLQVFAGYDYTQVPAGRSQKWQ
jgi:hypothetical protein